MKSILPIMILTSYIKVLNGVLALNPKSQVFSTLVLKNLGKILAKVNHIIKAKEEKFLIPLSYLRTYSTDKDWISFCSIQMNYNYLGNDGMEMMAEVEQQAIVEFLFFKWEQLKQSEGFKDLNWKQRQNLYLTTPAVFRI